MADLTALFNEFGQSIWLDNLSRAHLNDGSLVLVSLKVSVVLHRIRPFSRRQYKAPLTTTSNSVP